MNTIILTGILDSNPSPFMRGGIPCSRFNLSVERNYVQSNDFKVSDTFPCIAYRGVAETINKYCQKGSAITVTGTCTFRDKELEIQIKEVEFMRKRL